MFKTGKHAIVAAAGTPDRMRARTEILFHKAPDAVRFDSGGCTHDLILKRYGRLFRPDETEAGLAVRCSRWISESLFVPAGGDRAARYGSAPAPHLAEHPSARPPRALPEPETILVTR